MSSVRELIGRAVGVCWVPKGLVEDAQEIDAQIAQLQADSLYWHGKWQTAQDRLAEVERERAYFKGEADGWKEKFQRADDALAAEHEQKRRLVECVRRVRKINTRKVAGIEYSTNHGITAALATVSDLTADEVK